jgi:membrane protein DedA with SNARE-associated domain
LCIYVIKFAMIETAIQSLLHFLDSIGYTGLFIVSALESTFLPIPSEVTMIPTGYLIYQGKMSAIPAFLCTVAGTVVGSLVNYWVAYRFGRALFIKHGKYFLMNEDKLIKMEKFFAKHGPLSIFIGRLIFGVRHCISFPAGLARMHLGKFCFYTAAGGSLWIATLLGLGYAAGGNEEILATVVPVLKFGLLGIALIGLYIYARRQRKTQPPAP